MCIRDRVPGDKAQLLAALLAYRVIYYLLPLLLAALLLAWHESKAWHAPARQFAAAGESLLRELAPPLFAALVFAGGLILLLSGSTPAEAVSYTHLDVYKRQPSPLPIPPPSRADRAPRFAGTRKASSRGARAGQQQVVRGFGCRGQPLQACLFLLPGRLQL